MLPLENYLFKVAVAALFKQANVKKISKLFRFWKVDNTFSQTKADFPVDYDLKQPVRRTLGLSLL